MCSYSAKLPFSIGAHITTCHNIEVETVINEQHTIVSKAFACIKRNMCQVLGMLLYLDICIKKLWWTGDHLSHCTNSVSSKYRTL